MKNLVSKLITCFFLCLTSLSLAQTTACICSANSINISTGWDNGSSTPLADGAIDGDWVLTPPVGATTASTITFWATTSTLAKFIQPTNGMTNAGYYDYIYTFTVPSSSNGNFAISRIGGDNEVELFLDTNLVYASSFGGYAFADANTILPTCLNLTGIAPGTHTLRGRVHNHSSRTGFILEGCYTENSSCICPSLTFSAGPDVNSSSPVTLAATSGFDIYSWSPSASLDDPTIATPLASPSVSTTYTCNATHLGTELIVNGDFGMGNVGFASGYTYGGYVPCNYHTQPDFWNPSLTDHTATTDNAALIIDGCTTPNTMVWQQDSIAICPQTDYQFSLWMTRGDVALQQIEVKFNGVVQTIFLANVLTSGGGMQYDKFIYNWNSGSSTSVKIKLTDLELGGFGNDFIIDDISFRQACYYHDSVTVYMPLDCICPSLTFSAGPDVNSSSPVTLAATSGFDMYNWSPSASLDDPTIATPLASPSVSTTYTCTATHLGTELIVNGDFGMGNVGFASGYTYGGYVPCNYHTQPDFWNPSLTDHTATTDNAALIIDGCTTPNTMVWQQDSIAICPQTDYQFSLWMTRGDVALQQIEVKFNGVVQTIFLANVLTSGGGMQYDKFIYNWNSGSSTSVKIKLTDLELGGFGNDFIIDDISFRQACYYQDSVTVYMPLAIDDQILSEVNVYPQPANDLVMISYPETVKQMDLYDIQGQWLKNVVVSPSGKTEIELASLPSGLYFLQINGTMTKKILK